MEEKKKKDLKIKLEDLKVQSFVTELEPEVAFTAKGGDSAAVCSVIISAVSKIVSQTVENSGNSKWPCKKACSGGSGGSSGGSSGGGGNPSSN